MDGLPDLWHLQARTNWSLLLYRNLGGGHYAAPSAVPLAVSDPGSFKWADFDGDGDLDFVFEVSLSRPETFLRGVIARPEHAVTIYRNDGDFHFTPLGDPIPEAEARFLSVGDFDNDGDDDLTATVLESAPSPIGIAVPMIRVLLNQVSQPNPPPGPPSGLRAKVDGRSVWLTWSSAIDFNQSGGHTYNVRVGTRPGASDVVSSMSLTNGRRMVVEFGNAGSRTNLFLTNLIGETFYWSVQAVDNGFVGGPFAPEQSFIINLPGNQPPLIGEIADQTMAEDSSRVVQLIGIGPGISGARFYRARSP
jgi:hypothetical protein